MNIDAGTKTIGQLALEVPQAIPILEKWGIDYCCRGHYTIEDACRAAGVAAGDLLSALEPPRDEATWDWSAKSLVELVQYILETHHAYTRQAIETVTLLSEKVAARHGSNHAEVLNVRGLVVALVNDLEPHMMKEEQILFPYVEALETGEVSSSCFGTVANPIRVMMMEHESVGEILVELRRVTSGYALPEDACLSFRALYERLADLEQDLHRHIHLENDVLFPRALQLEASVLSVAG
jgi:regulator of cell morphogenesis and NO signaling